MKSLTSYETQTIQALREDNRSLKKCYTDFSFQAIAFSAAILGVIARYQPDYPYFGLASIATIILLSTVARIGTYKYTSANRQYGYELHLFRTRHLVDNHEGGWKGSMRDIGWEEAMRAWRIIQPTVFRHLYYTEWPIPNLLRWKHRNRPYQWFNPKKLAAPKATYYSGSYLSVMNSILHSFSALSTIPLVLLAFQLDTDKILPLRFGLILPSILFIGIAHRFVSDVVRVRVLESGLLSIHSCSIMWEAVVVAHYRALKQSNAHKHYTEHLAEQANSLVDNIFNIHEWVQGSHKPAPTHKGKLQHKLKAKATAYRLTPINSSVKR